MMTEYFGGLRLLMLAVSLPLVAGCPGAPGVNLPPTANAGADQTVTGGQTVTLDGSLSSDPDGDALTFSWSQTAGTAVTLSNASSASPTFVAPNTTETLTFQLTVSDGQVTATDSVNINVTTTGTNLAPVANAGTNQTVAAGATVNLNGSASSDPEGAALTFSWTQVSGTAVTLTGANTATPSFTAPAVSGTLVFQLTVSDGTLTDTDTVSVAVTTAPVLLIANITGNNIVAYDITTPQSVNGNIAPDANLQGAQTLLVQPSDIVLDAGGGLLVSNFAGQSVTGYANAVELSGINGNVAPTRNVQGAATLLAGPTTLAVNPQNDLLFVANITGVSVIRVYANASTAAFNGNLPPLRSITSANLNQPFGINFGANDELYVANNALNNVAVFAGASNLNGNVAATRILTSAAFGALFDVFVDPGDTLYVVNSAGGGNRVHIFNNASTLNGAVNPNFTLTVQGALNITAIAVDSTGVGYIVDNTANAVYSYDNIATRNGTLPPDRTLQGANTQLNGPIRVFLAE